MRSKIDFTTYWKEHGTDTIPELHARFIWDTAQAIGNGWGLDASCSECKRTDRPRKARGMCTSCYQLSRYHIVRGNGA